MSQISSPPRNPQACEVIECSEAAQLMMSSACTEASAIISVSAACKGLPRNRMVNHPDSNLAAVMSASLVSSSQVIPINENPSSSTNFRKEIPFAAIQPRSTLMNASL